MCGLRFGDFASRCALRHSFLDVLPGASVGVQQVGSDVSLTLVAAVPEPSTYAMALAGLACGGFSMWRRRKRA